MLIRHGETANNAGNCFTGQADVPLSPLGEQQAQAVGNYLADEALDALFSSDLQRARSTAQFIAEHHQLSLQEEPRLRELSLGRWEGVPFAEVEQHEPELLRCWRSDAVDYAPPGGETLTVCRERLMQVVEECLQSYPKGRIVWVVHAGVIGILLCALLELDLNRRWQFHHDNVSVTELLFRPQGVSLVRLNETAFLRKQIRVQQLHVEQV